MESAESTLVLPVRPPSPRDHEVRFESAETAPPLPATVLAEGFDLRTVTEDAGANLQTIELVSDHGRSRYDDRAIAGGEADTESAARTELTADETHFTLSWRQEARERGTLVHSASATQRIRRDFA